MNNDEYGKTVGYDPAEACNQLLIVQHPRESYQNFIHKKYMLIYWEFDNPATGEVERWDAMDVEIHCIRNNPILNRSFVKNLYTFEKVDKK